MENFNKKMIRSLILILVLFLPFNFHYIFNFNTTQNISFFKENLQYSIYFFDVIFLLTLFFWLRIKIIKKSLAKFIKSNKLLWFLTAYLLFNTFLISTNSFISLYNSLRTLELLIFFLILIEIIDSQKYWQKILAVIFFSGIIQSIIALFQFLIQKSLGLKYLGESLLSPQILGVAKLEVSGEKFIRAYGTFPHPNLLAIFLFLSLTLGIFLFINREKLLINLNKFHLLGGIALISIGILNTFSRSIWLITTFLVLFLIIRYCGSTSWQTIISNLKLKKSIPYFAIIFTFLVLFFGILYQFIQPRICYQNCQDQSLILRQKYSNFSQQIIRNNLLTGIGIGQFTSVFSIINPYNLDKWDIQPVHNLYLLITSEIGLLGLILILLFFLSKADFHFFKNPLLAFLFLSFLMIAFFDHYFWTIPQGQFILWLTLALLVGWGKMKDSTKY
jgi:O-antigen ligase